MIVILTSHLVPPDMVVCTPKGYWYPRLRTPAPGRLSMFLAIFQCFWNALFRLIRSGRVVLSVAIRAGGLGVDFRPGKVGHSFTHGSPPLWRFCGAVLPKRQTAEMGPRHSLHASA